MPEIFRSLELIARSGGGGSSSGGGDGGIFVLLGYLPAHWWGSLMRKKLNNPVGLVLSIVGVIVYSIIWFFIGGWGILVGILALVGGPAGFFNWFGKISGKTRKRAQAAITTAAATDPAWDVAALTQRVQAVFNRFQYDWSTFDTESMKTYLTPSYAYHIELMLYALRLRNRQNSVYNPQLIEAIPVEVVDLGDNSQDRVTFYINAKADDQLFETPPGGQPTMLFRDTNDFHEYWQFARVNNQWMLDGISQLTENKFMLQDTIREFAAANNLRYSPDWGWLLLPSRGQIFKGGKFGISDVNNHVVGMYNNLLMELYTYVPKPGSSTTNYTIAQVALPKYYGSIIVEAKSGFSLFKKVPSGYKKVTLEWGDFNKRYNVYATSPEQATAFELLHPAYMEKLFALPFKVSIEVVDNVVYLYSTDKKADYMTMYSLLQAAFKEMRM